MKSILIYFRRDDSLGRGRMSPSGRGECLPRAGEDVSLGRGRASNPSGGWHVATGSILLSVLLLSSCSTTKNLPEGAVLYTGIKKIEVKNEDKTKPGEAALEEVEAALAYPPNNALLGSSSIRVPFPFGLWVYNAFVNKKGKVGKWIFNKLASKPVLITTVNPDVRVKVARNLLNEYGYFNGETFFRGHTRSQESPEGEAGIQCHHERSVYAGQHPIRPYPSPCRLIDRCHDRRSYPPQRREFQCRPIASRAGTHLVLAP